MRFPTFLSSHSHVSLGVSGSTEFYSVVIRMDESKYKSVRERLSQKYDHPEIKEAQKREVLDTWVGEVERKSALASYNPQTQEEKSKVEKLVRRVQDREKKAGRW